MTTGFFILDRHLTSVIFTHTITHKYIYTEIHMDSSGTADPSLIIYAKDLTTQWASTIWISITSIIICPFSLLHQGLVSVHSSFVVYCERKEKIRQIKFIPLKQWDFLCTQIWRPAVKKCTSIEDGGSSIDVLCLLALSVAALMVEMQTGSISQVEDKI